MLFSFFPTVPNAFTVEKTRKCRIPEGFLPFLPYYYCIKCEVKTSL